jgi:hypothetical protein
MHHSLLFRSDPVVVCILLLIGMVVMVIVGRVASRMWNKDADEPKGGVHSLFGALFAVSGLILAFSFGMSQTRLERVRSVVEQEANAIGTAVLRADLYSDSVRQAFRLDFKNYVEAVIGFYQNAHDPVLFNKAREDAANATTALWARVTQQSKLPNMLIPSTQMIPALNNMFDSAQTREIVLNSRVPDLIEYMLFVCLLATCFIGGFTSARFTKKEWIVTFGFAIVTTMVVYTTIDLSRPLRGMIRTDEGQQAIVDLRKMFQEYP